MGLAESINIFDVASPFASLEPGVAFIISEINSFAARY
jgi:hypothetical protein